MTRRPGRPREIPMPCPVCRRPCLGHVLSGLCSSCAATDAIREMDAEAARLALERGAAGRTAPVVDAGAEPRQDWLERPD